MILNCRCSQKHEISKTGQQCEGTKANANDHESGPTNADVCVFHCRLWLL